MTEQELYEKVRDALAGFFREDQDLLDVNASERSITHKLAEHLQKQFTEHKVDCEYNRHGIDIKRLEYYCDDPIRPEDQEAKTVFPDIIVHKRGNDDYNEVVIEAKKKTSARSDIRCDVEKLKAYTGMQYSYKYGLLMLFDTDRKCIDDIRYFQDGHELEEHNWNGLKELNRG